MRVGWPAVIVVSLGCLSASEAAAQGLPLVIQPDVPQPSREVAPPQEVDPDAPARRRPGRVESYPEAVIQSNPGAVSAPPPDAFPADHLPLPDRWRLIEAVGVNERWFDPYNQNTLKGDRPLPGHESLFVVLGAVSDTVIEPRSLPLPVGVQTTQDPNSLDVFGRSNSLILSQTVIASVALIEGSTAFKPPDFEARLTLAFNYSDVSVPERRILSVLPSREPDRQDSFLGVQEAFFDYHLRNVSKHADDFPRLNQLT